jgi:hypothetical protein
MISFNDRAMRYQVFFFGTLKMPGAAEKRLIQTLMKTRFGPALSGTRPPPPWVPKIWVPGHRQDPHGGLKKKPVLYSELDDSVMKRDHLIGSATVPLNQIVPNLDSSVPGILGRAKEKRLTSVPMDTK